LGWKYLKQQPYHFLASIDLKALAIPATSTPSERVFLVAGITIATERSWLDPDNAAELLLFQ
jgi:hypothetical protein